MIAALYVEADGVYANLEGVDAWPEERDARLYAGPWPVVAHPPCSVWCQLASVNEARYGHPVGEDDGMFAAALAAVREFGGVLEHPAYSVAWQRFGLPRPQRGGWTTAFGDPGATTEVSQSAYGNVARKRTWLYAVGADLSIPIDWSEPPARAVVGAGVNSGESLDMPRATPTEAIGTPLAFRELLMRLAGYERTD